jgi:thymidylate kinase
MKELCEETGLNAVFTQEAGNPALPICKIMRDLALDTQHKKTCETMELLFAAQYFENHQWFMDLPPETQVVVSDRGLASHFAYGRPVVGDKIDILFSEFCSEIIQDMRAYVIYLKVDIDEATRRLNRRRAATSADAAEPLDNVEALGSSHQEKVKFEYERLFEERKDLFADVFTIDANGSPEEVKEALRWVLNELLLIR